MVGSVHVARLSTWLTLRLGDRVRVREKVVVRVRVKVRVTWL